MCVSLFTAKNAKTVEFLNSTIQWAGWNATPEHTDTLKA
jgi:hypothetical protein